jgi:DNA-directed RNA polymerase subunit alpha
LTVGNALRRVLLSALEGYAISFVEGEIMSFLLFLELLKTLPKIILNLKQVRFKRQIEDIDNEVVFLFQVKINTAGDFQNSFQVSKF